MVSGGICSAVPLIPNGVEILKNIQETLWTTGARRKDNFWEKTRDTIVMELLPFPLFNSEAAAPLQFFSCLFAGGSKVKAPPRLECYFNA